MKSENPRPLTTVIVVVLVTVLVITAGVVRANISNYMQSSSSAASSETSTTEPRAESEPEPESEAAPLVLSPGLSTAMGAIVSTTPEWWPEEETVDERAQELALDPSRTDWNYSSNGRRVVYLTIDDGPSERTAEVLDILDKYGVKATFFVTGHEPAYFHMIKEAYDRGHTIGLHTMTHDYAWIYSSVGAYFDDLEQIGQVVEEQIGFVPCFIRFPGGSSNTISAKFSKGIMSALVGEVQGLGYQYYDWNVSTGDGSEHTADELYEYAIEGNPPGTYPENIVMLCHDSAPKQTTVEALPRIIEYYQGMGYTFEAIDRSTCVMHHSVSN